MSLPRFSLLGRPLLSTTSASCFSTLNQTTSRAFTSYNQLRREQNPSSGAEISEESRKRSVAVLKLPRQVSKREIEGVFAKEGLQILKSQLRFDRFTFYNDTYFFAELANPQQVTTALTNLNESTVFSETHPILLRPLDTNYRWKSTVNSFNRFAYDEGRAVLDAALPIKEGRRIQLRVKTPAWRPKFEDKPEHLQTQRKHYGQQLVAKAFDRFGIEAMGSIASNDGRMLPDPKFYCQIDFKTKEGAEDAIHHMNNTVLEGQLIWVAKMTLNEVRARQIGRVNMGLLEELQGLGLAPEVTSET